MNIDLPGELSVNWFPYVSLIGLDVVNNRLHSLIWNSFALNRTQERPALNYKLDPLDHKFPQPKNKKPRDRYVPNGIIKKKWLYKHLSEVPSVVIVFEQTNWSYLIDEGYRKKLSNKINFFKNDLIGKQVKITLILLLNDPINDDSSYKDQATKLCEECDISPKSFFVLPVNDEASIFKYVVKIESSVYELVKNYCAIKYKQIKSNKDQLSKILQNYLFVRYEFKLGFYNEIRLIYNTALNHYKTAYANLMETRITSSNISEIKNIAGLLNYKIVRLCFYLNVPLDAISYFKKHIEIFLNKFLSEHVKFEHYAWLSKQFFMFAELFDMAINLFHLSPSATQNPGTYYFESAMYTAKRRDARKNIQFTMEEMNLITDILSRQDDNHFIGQIPWFNDDSYSEELKFKVFHYAEQLVDLTPFLISVYSNVLNQIKKLKKPRFIRYLMFLIGQEYYNIGNYSEAMNYFCNILTFYREEKWRFLHHKIVQLALSSAYLSVDYTNFIKCGFEYVSSDMDEEKEKHDLIDCLISYLKIEYKPLSLAFFDNILVDNYHHQWIERLRGFSQNGSPNEIVINVDHEISFMKYKVCFSSHQYSCEDEIFITIWVFNQLPIDLNDISLQIKFENPQLDKHASPVGKSDKILHGNSLSKFQFKLEPLCKFLECVQNRIKIIEVILVIQSKVSVKFQWSLSKRPMIPVQGNSQDVLKFNNVDERIFAAITEIDSKLEIDVTHAKNFFINENVMILLRIVSREKHPIINLKFSPSILQQFSQEIDSSHEWFICRNDTMEKIIENQLIVDRIEPGQSLCEQLVLRFFTIGAKIISMNFPYEINLINQEDGTIKRTLSASKTFTRTVEVIEPFSYSNQVSNYASSETANIRCDEPFRLNIQLRSTNSSIEVHETNSKFPEGLNVLSHQPSQLPMILSSDSESILHEQFLLSSLIESPLYSLGTWWIKWSRKENDIPPEFKRIFSETIFVLPSITISSALIYVELFLPEKIYARNPFMAKYKIYNRLDFDVIIEVNMNNAEFFMFSGNRQVKVNLSSKSFVEQSFLFFPLTCGQLILPKIDILVQPIGQNSIKIDYINQMISSTVFVLPKLRTEINL